jgi:hypothetical protein
LVSLVSNQVYDYSIRRKILKFSVVCSGCEAHGPVSHIKNDAVDGWNGVPSLEQAKVLEEALCKHFEVWIKKMPEMSTPFSLSPSGIAKQALSVFRQTN